MKFMEISNGLSIYEHYKLDAEEENTPQKYFFIFNEKDLLLIDNEVPLLNSLMDIGIEEENIANNIFMGQFHDKDTYVICLDLDEESKSKLIESNEGFEFVFLAKVFDINEEIYLLGGRATQIIDWDNNHKYCGKCGAETIYSQTEKGAKLCPECGFTSFTRISPAIITTIIKEEVNQEGKVENKLLMARHSYYENIRYSLIAGFMEAGETIEEALKREVKEEVGINVKDLEYFGSQSWPFPNSLMIGIICKYDSGEIKVDGNEITKAEWFKKEDIEFDGYQLSIAYKLIQNFIDNY